MMLFWCAGSFLLKARVNLTKERSKTLVRNGHEEGEEEEEDAPMLGVKLSQENSGLCAHHSHSTIAAL